MRRLAAWCVRHRRITVLGWIAILVVSALAAGAAGATFKSNFDLPSSDSQRALDLLASWSAAPATGDALRVTGER